MKLLARITDRRRKRAQRKLEFAARRTVYSRSREGRAADEHAQRDTNRSGIPGAVDS